MKYKKILTMFIFGCSSIFGNEPEPNPRNHEADTLFVSLGSHCEAAVFLQENNLRKSAYPFDWLLSSTHAQFISLLNKDFEFLTEESCFIQHPVYPHVLENCYYEIEFRHDWLFSDLMTSPIRYREQIEEIQKKYGRRIERFRQLRSYTKKVFFIRVAFEYLNEPNPYWRVAGIEQISAIQAAELKEVLDRYFPNLDFKLIIINYEEENAPVISGIDGVIEFKIRKSEKHADYKKLFKSLLNE